MKMYVHASWVRKNLLIEPDTIFCEHLTGKGSRHPRHQILLKTYITTKKRIWILRILEPHILKIGTGYVRQGCNLSPLLYNRYLEFIMSVTIDLETALVIVNGKPITNIRQVLGWYSSLWQRTSITYNRLFRTV